jgi:hypothetical protein
MVLHISGMEPLAYVNAAHAGQVALQNAEIKRARGNDRTRQLAGFNRHYLAAPVGE